MGMDLLFARDRIEIENAKDDLSVSECLGGERKKQIQVRNAEGAVKQECSERGVHFTTVLHGKRKYKLVALD